LVVIILGLVASILMGCRAERAREQEAVARVEAEQARDKEAALRAQVEQALARAEKAEKNAQEQRKLAEERAESYRRAVYSNTLALAKVAIDKGSIDRAQKLLNSCESDLQGWEWQHLNYISSDQSIMTFADTCIGIIVFDIAVSPDGRRIALATNNNHTVRVLDTKTGSEVMILPHNPYVYTMAFSPDGRRIVSGSRDGTIKIWDAGSGAKLKTLRGHKSWIWRVRFSPDGRRIVSGSGNGTIKVWDADSGVEVMTLRGHNGRRIGAIAFSPDGKRIVSSGRDKTIRVWDANSGDEEMTINATGRDVAFSPDGTRIVAISDDDTIKVWDANSGAEVMTLRGPPGGFYAIALSPDGKRIVSGGEDKTIKVWDMSTGNEMSTLQGHSEDIFSIVFSPDGKRIFSASYYNNEIKAWDPAPAIDRDVHRLFADTSGTNQVAFSPDGKRIAAASGERWTTGSIRLYDTHSGAEIMPLRDGHPGQIHSIAFSSDGRQIVSGGQDETVRIWNVATGTVEKTLTGHENRVNSVAFSPDGRRVVSGSNDKTIKIWNTATGALEKTLTGDENGVDSVTFSPDGKRIVSGGYGGSLRVWDALSGTPLLSLHGHSEHVLDVSVSPDGKCIASCGRDKTIRIWDADTGEALMTLRGHELVVWTVAFSPDGRRIVSGGHNGEVKIWDAGTGVELMTLYGDPSDIKSAAFSPDGRSVCVGGGGGGNITLWESVEPAAGNEPRRIANSARDLVEELYKKHGLYHEVMSKLRDDNTIDGPVRRVALQIANAHLWEDAEKLNQQGRSVIFSTDLDDVEYREALEKFEKVVSLEPNNIKYLSHLGVAQYRVGAYEETLVTLARAKKMRDDAGIEPSPTTDGFKAMALHQLGRDKQAHAVMQEARSGYLEEGRFSGMYTRVFLKRAIEIEKFFAGEDSTLLSIWELIEENKLDEASEFIEKARLSKNADYVNRMEGAIKLLEVLRNLK
jgi:WD40 repeat protein